MGIFGYKYGYEHRSYPKKWSTQRILVFFIEELYAIKPVRITFGMDEKSKTGGGYPSQQVHQQFWFLLTQGSGQAGGTIPRHHQWGAGAANLPGDAR